MSICNCRHSSACFLYFKFQILSVYTRLLQFTNSPDIFRLIFYTKVRLTQDSRAIQVRACCAPSELISYSFIISDTFIFRNNCHWAFISLSLITHSTVSFTFTFRWRRVRCPRHFLCCSRSKEITLLWKSVLTFDYYSNIHTFASGPRSH